MQHFWFWFVYLVPVNKVNCFHLVLHFQPQTSDSLKCYILVLIFGLFKADERMLVSRRRALANSPIRQNFCDAMASSQSAGRSCSTSASSSANGMIAVGKQILLYVSSSCFYTVKEILQGKSYNLWHRVRGYNLWHRVRRRQSRRRHPRVVVLLGLL